MAETTLTEAEKEVKDSFMTGFTKKDKIADIVRLYVPGISDAAAMAIAWNETGFPEFWPDANLSPEQNFRNQLQSFAERSQAEGYNVEEVFG